MNKKHAFFVVLAVAVSANHFALSSLTVAEKSHGVDMMTNNTLHEERVGPTIKLFGTKIPVPESVEAQVPEVVDQLASQGNIRNHIADNIEKPKQRVTNGHVGTQSGETSSAQGKHLSTMTGAGPRDPTVLGHRVRGVKRKASSRDEAQRQQSRQTQKEVQAGQEPTVYYTLPTLIARWHIDDKQIEQREEEFLKHGLPQEISTSPSRVESMAVGSIFFEHKLPESQGEAKLRKLNRIRKNLKSQKGVIKELGLEYDKVSNWAFRMYEIDDWRPSVKRIVDMAIGTEYYRLLQARGFLLGQ